MVRINLIPEAIVLGRTYRRRAVLWLCACATALLLVLVPVGIEGWQRAEADEARGALEALWRDRDAVKAEMTSLAAESESVFLQLERANALRAKRAWSGILNLVAQTLPDACWLTSIETDPAVPPGGPAASPPRPAAATPATPNESGTKERIVTIEAPRRLKLHGYAKASTDPLVFVQNLNATGVFQAVSLQQASQEPVEDGFRFRFEVHCEW